MSRYVLKRLLIMVPTFFAISLVVFVIVNVAPGRPSTQTLGDEDGKAASTTSEHWQVFKSQFHLDKPVLFNLRFLTSKEDVKQALQILFNQDGTFDRSQKGEKLEWLSDLGHHSVKHLVEIARDETDEDIRRLAVKILSQNAKRDVKYEYGADSSAMDNELNERIRLENTKLESMIINEGDTSEVQTQVVTAWQKWFDEVKDERYKEGFARNIGVFFVETRFAHYWSNLARLDFGVSNVDKRPVIGKVISKLKYSLTLAVPSIVLAYLIAILLGVIQATKKGRTVDKTISVVSFAMYSLPSFFTATLLLMLFSTGSDYWHWFPTSGWQSDDANQMTTLGKIVDVAWHMVLPVFCLTMGQVALLSRYVRTGLVDVLGSDYIRTARSKGVPEFQVVTRHALRNGIIPIVVLLGTVLPVLVGGSVIVEVVFGIPGMGMLVYDAIMNRDYNTVLAVQLIVAVLVMLGILLSDILHAVVDPRVRLK